jgi:broad specificity phosphatase PhoE
MRTLEHRRHSRRDPGGVHLNADGLALAHSVAAGLPRFDRVVTSPLPRAVETAEALGLTVDTTLAGLAEVPDDVVAVFESLPRPARSFERIVEHLGRSREAAEFAHRELAQWRSELERVPEGGRLLMISHGGFIELVAASALPEVVRGWGPPLGYLEGVRLTWDGRRWTSAEVLRVRV